MSENKVLDSGSRFLDLMRKQIPQMPGIELATVVQADPLIIRIDNMSINLQGDDLIVCEHLLEHSINYSTSPTISGITNPGGSDGHTHSFTSFNANQQSMTVHTQLKIGDRIAVMALPGGQQYLVWDKVVIMGA